MAEARSGVELNCGVITREIGRDTYDAAAVGSSLAPFQVSAWLEALSGPGRRPIYFEFRCDGRRVGLTGGLEVTSNSRTFATLSRYAYLYGFPDVLPELAAASISSLKQWLRARGFNTLEMAYYDNPASLRLGDYGMRTRQAVEYRLDLSPSVDELQRRLNRLRHRLIRRAVQNNLHYEESQDIARIGDLKLCLGQTKARRSERGVGHYHYYYIPFLDERALGRLLKSGLGRVCIISKEARVVSAGFYVRNRRRTYYILAGATREGYGLGASTYMQWCIIERSKAAGCEWLNLGGVPHDKSAPQLIQFKESFGARPTQCEAGSCYLLGPWRMWLHRAYKVAANPRGYFAAVLDWWRWVGRRRPIAVEQHETANR